jgi:nitric oxide reductase large subunit
MRLSPMSVKNVHDVVHLTSKYIFFKLTLLRVQYRLSVVTIKLLTAGILGISSMDCIQFEHKIARSVH